jgi:hypothetical protein
MTKYTQFVLKRNFLLAIGLIIHSFTSNQTFAQTGNRNPVELRIDPHMAFGGSSSQVFKEVNYIPLETTKESVFGKIDKLYVTDNFYIIFDRETNAVLLFNKSGKFHGKIDGGNPNSSNHRNYIIMCVVDKWNSQILITKAGYQKTMYYNFDGKKLKEENEKFNYEDLCFLSFNTRGLYSYSVDQRYPDSTGYEIRILQDSIIKKSYFTFNFKRSNVTSNEIEVNSPTFFYEVTNSVAFFSRPFMYKIYQLTPDTLFEAFNFIFPAENSLPSDFTINPVYNGKRKKYYEQNKSVIYGLSHLYHLGNNLFFKTRDWDGSNLDNSFVFNTKSEKLISLKRVVSDSSSFYLPVAGDMPNAEFENSNFLGSDGDYLYTAYSSLTMFQCKESLPEGKHPIFNKILNDYFVNGKKTDNPVIVQLKPKDIL